MAGYIGTKAALLSTTTASVGGDSTVGGDLTVDTDTLYVDSTNNRVGIGTSSPQAELHLSTASTPEMRLTDTTNSVEANFFANDSVGTIGSKSNHDFVFNTNNTERVRIDSSGRVTMPYQPAFSAYVSSSYSTSSTASKVLYNNTWINQGSHFNTSTSTFTAPLGGKYKFNSRVSLLVGSGEYARAANVMFYVNGSLYGASYHNIRNVIPSVSGSAVYHGLEGSAIINLSANDTVSVYLNWETDGTLDASETVHYHGTYFEGHLIG